MECLRNPWITQNYILHSRLFYKCKTQMPPGWTEMTRSLRLVLMLSFLLHWKKYDEIFAYLLPRIFSTNCFPNPLFISETIEHKTWTLFRYKIEVSLFTVYECLTCPFQIDAYFSFWLYSVSLPENYNYLSFILFHIQTVPHTSQRNSSNSMNSAKF